jgi:hypothetical protein
VRDDAAGASWDALLSADRDLTLQGLELLAPAGAEAWPLVRIERAALRLEDCVLRSEHDAGGPAAVLHRGTGLFARACRVEAGGVALAVQAGELPCRVRLEGCQIDVRAPHGAALSLWASGPGGSAPVEAHLAGNTIGAGRVLACRALGGPLTIRADGNAFAFRTALFSFDGYRRPDDWRRTTTWQGRENRYRAGAGWLRVEGKPRPEVVRFEK